MRMTPGSRKEPHLADPPGTTRTPAAAYPRFSGSLSAYSNGPSSIVSIDDNLKSRRMACFNHV